MTQADVHALLGAAVFIGLMGLYFPRFAFSLVVIAAVVAIGLYDGGVHVGQ